MNSNTSLLAPGLTRGGFKEWLLSFFLVEDGQQEHTRSEIKPFQNNAITVQPRIHRPARGQQTRHYIVTTVAESTDTPEAQVKLRLELRDTLH